MTAGLRPKSILKKHLHDAPKGGNGSNSPYAANPETGAGDVDNVTIARSTATNRLGLKAGTLPAPTSQGYIWNGTSWGIQLVPKGIGTFGALSHWSTSDISTLTSGGTGGLMFDDATSHYKMNLGFGAVLGMLHIRQASSGSVPCFFAENAGGGVAAIHATTSGSGTGAAISGTASGSAAAIRGAASNSAGGVAVEAVVTGGAIAFSANVTGLNGQAMALNINHVSSTADAATITHSGLGRSLYIVGGNSSNTSPALEIFAANGVVSQLWTPSLQMNGRNPAVGKIMRSATSDGDAEWTDFTPDGSCLQGIRNGGTNFTTANAANIVLPPGDVPVQISFDAREFLASGRYSSTDTGSYLCDTDSASGPGPNYLWSCTPTHKANPSDYGFTVGLNIRIWGTLPGTWAGGSLSLIPHLNGGSIVADAYPGAPQVLVDRRYFGSSETKFFLHGIIDIPVNGSTDTLTLHMSSDDPTLFHTITAYQTRVSRQYAHTLECHDCDP